jgi:hypothetical protein
VFFVITIMVYVAFVFVCVYVYEIKTAKGGGYFRSKSLVLFIELQGNFVWKGVLQRGLVVLFCIS